MQKDHEELKRLRVEVQRLEVECRQGKTLNKNLTQIKGEKGILEEKVIKIKVIHTFKSQRKQSIYCWDAVIFFL